MRAIDTPFSETTLQVLAGSLGRFGDREAILYFDRDGVKRWTYRELGEAVHRLAGGLLAEGLGPGSTIAVCAANRPEWIVACFAIWRAGAIAVPLDTQMSDEAMRHALNDAEVRLVFTQASEVERIEALATEGTRIVLLQGEREGLPGWRDLGVNEDQNDPPQSRASLPEVGLDDLACIFYTSGTTGPPKGVPLTHRNLAFQIEALDKIEIVGPGDRALLPLPLHHVYPFVVGMLTPIALGLPLLLPRALIGPHIVEAISKGGATVMIGVPRLYRALVDGLKRRLASQGLVSRIVGRGLISLSTGMRRRLGLHMGKRLLKPLHQRMGPDLRLLVSGGAALKPELTQTLEGIGWTVATGYGLTETSPLVAANFPGESRFESAGKIVEGVEVRIDSDAVPEGTEGDSRLGEVLVRGPNVFTHYHQLPEKTEEAFTEDGWFRTGDLGFVDADGYLHLGGRRSTMIVTEGGKNVQPDELEEAYQAEPEIGEIVVMSRDEKIVGLIVPDFDVVTARDPKEVEGAVRKAVEKVSRRLPSYKRLADFALTRESLPRTRLGKPRRHLLEERYEQASQDKDAAGAPERKPVRVNEMSAEDRSLLEDPSARKTWEWLVERFADRRLTPDSDLRLDLGVDSMEWLNMTMELSSRTGAELSEDAIARIESVRDLLEEVTQSEGQAAAERQHFLDDPEGTLTDEQKQWLRPQTAVQKVMGRLAYGLTWLVMRGLFRLDIRGAEHLPAQGPYVLAPNHVSYLDPFAVAIALRYPRLLNTYWAGWTGLLFANRFIRRFSRIAQVVPIDPDRAVGSSLAFGAAVLRRERMLVWFPEGGRSDTGRLIPFKPGLGLLLERFRVPVLPVIIEGAYEALPRHRALPRFHRIRVTIHPPIDPQALEAEGQGKDAAQRIMSGLERHMADRMP
jgi:long-chain acyl-CoA synthetase